MIISQLSDIFCTILIMSLSGSALILLLFALKPLMRHRLSKSAQYVLWLITLAALLVPVSKLIAIPEAPTQIIVAPIQTVVEQNNILAEEKTNAAPQTNTDTYSEAEATVIPAATPAPDPVLVAAIVFIMMNDLLIVLVVLSYYIVSYIRFTKKVRRHRTRARMEELYEYAGMCGDMVAPRLYRSALATTPMLIGIFKPEIILPDREYTEGQIQSVLKHELIHIRRRDIIFKWLSVFACALHWFNPLAWLARREIGRICELSCDEAVIRNLDHKEKQNYEDTLTSITTDTNASKAVLYTTISEEKEMQKERLNEVVKYQKRTWVTLITSTVVVAMAVCAVLVFGAGAAPSSAPGDYRADAAQPAFMQNVLPMQMPASTPVPSVLSTSETEGTMESTDNGSAIPLATPAPTSSTDPLDEVIEFKDPIVEKVIRTSIVKPEGPINVKDMMTITSFEYDPVNDKNATGTITTLDDLRFCVNLERLRVLHQPVTSIECLRDLDRIQVVCILGCSVSDLSPLTGKNILREVWISGNPVTDASPVLALPNLIEFNAYYGTGVTDISAIPATSCLQNFYCDNKLEDYSPLLRSKTLQSVELAGISDSFFRELIKKFRSMSSIRISNSDIKDQSLKLLEGYNLYGLSLENCGLEDISGLEGLMRVDDLRLGGNQIEDISVLEHFTQISYCLDLRDNNIRDFSPLKSIKLTSLYIMGNPNSSKASKAVLDELRKGGCTVNE